MALFLTTDEFKKYVSIDDNVRFDTLKPFIEEAEQLYLVDLLGDAFYTSLSANYNAATAGEVTGDNVALLPYVQRSLAYYTMLQAFDQIGLNVGDAGMMQTRGDNTEPAPKWKIDALKLNYATQADLQAERLLKYLEDNAVNGGTFTEWFNSSANTRAEGLIVSSSRIASEYIDINENRRIFKRLKKRIKEIEQNHILRQIGKPQYDEIVSQIKANTLSADVENAALVEYLKPIICKKALYELLPMIKVSITENGLTVYSSNDGTINKQAAGKEEIKHLMWSLRDSETGYENDIQQLKEFIEDNIDDYPLIKESTAYTSRPDPGPQRPPENLSTNKHFSL